jgi:hypothetical protein
MPGHRHPVFFPRTRPERARARLGAALLVLVCAALCGAALCALPQAARAEAAPGEFVWPTPWLFGTTDTSTVVDLERGPSGSVYAVGRTGYGPAGGDAFVARLRTSDGSRVWRKVRAGLRPAAAAVDAARNVVLVGAKAGDLVVVKYRAGGGLAWARRWGGAGAETAADVAVAPDGSIYVAGTRRTAATGKDAVVLCLSPGGAVRWSHLAATRGADAADAVATDGAGNVYVTGSREGGATRSIWSTTKLSHSGRRLWRRDVTFISSNTFGWGRWLQVRGDSLYVVAQRGKATYRFAAMKLSLAGRQRWLKGSYVLPGPVMFEDAAVDAEGRLYMVGVLQPSGTAGVSAQGELLVCRADGAMAWHDAFEDPLGAFDTSFHDVVVDGSRRAWCSGFMATSVGGDLAAVVLRYRADGGIETIWRWDGGVGGHNEFGPLLGGSVILAGGRATTAGGSRAVVQRLRP